ncbi:MAG: class I tRNA ligase family protein, partial [Patescibacteria group bacterium]
RYHLAGEKIYHYLWHELADKIIEESKTIFIGENAETKLSRQHTLLTILKNSLIILHPFMPFITEEIWTQLMKPKSKEEMLIIAPWPHQPQP